LIKIGVPKIPLDKEYQSILNKIDKLSSRECFTFDAQNYQKILKSKNRKARLNMKKRFIKNIFRYKPSYSFQIIEEYFKRFKK
jgi:predicted SprT family Zn-dependent metalloprotease